MTRPYDGQRLDPARAAALNRLHNAVGEAVEVGATIPCIGRDRDDWLAEDVETQRRAADRCLDACPVFVACLDYVTKFPEQTVMGGELPTPIQKVRSK